MRVFTRWGLACLMGLLAAAAAVAQQPVDDSRMSLTVVERGGQYEIWVTARDLDGAAQRKRLHVTPRSIVALESGGVATEAPFVNWSEAGERFSTFSRDAGSTWTEPRRLDNRLRMLGSAVAPGEPLPAPAPALEAAEDHRLFIVQFRGVSLPEWRAVLESSEVEVLRFFPMQAHLVRMDPARVASVRGLDFVQRVEPYHPAYRLEPFLVDWLAQEAEVEPRQIRVRAMAFDWGPQGKGRIASDARKIGANVDAEYPNGHVVELTVDRDQLRRLAGHDDTLWIDRWVPRENDMDLIREDSGADYVEQIEGYCGQGVRGEVLDNGFDLDHQDFDGVILHGSGNSLDFFAQSHGSSSYGVVFGNGDRDGDGDGTATGHMPCNEQGIASDYSFLGDRFAHTQELKEAPFFASFQTNSWGGSRTTEYTSLSSEMDDIIFRLDIAILQSQSNAGSRDSRPQAWAKNIISVGAVDHENTLDTSDDTWGSASIGPAADGRIKPDVHYFYDFIRTTAVNDGYTTFGGTSGATPTAAGVLGLMLQMWSENLWGTNPVGSSVFERQPHFSTLKALLINNSWQYTFSGAADNLTRVHQGWGRPSARLAYDRAVNSFIVDQDQVLELSDQVNYLVEVPVGESELKVTMVYPDPPGTTSAGLHRINDLSVRVVSPSGTVYHGNVGLDLGNYSQSGGSANVIDTVENVFVQNPEAGTWTIEVTAQEINQDGYLDTPANDAVFSLVVTGASATTGSPTPGEAASSNQLLVSGYDRTTGVLSLTYGTSCSATDHVIEYGPLDPASIGSYAWSGQECGVGTSGSYAWDTTASPGSLFFVIVGQSLDAEGSYGLDSAGQERPEDSLSTTCPRVQDLSQRCD